MIIQGLYVCFFFPFRDVFTYLILVVKKLLKTKIHDSVATCQQFWTPSLYLDYLNTYSFHFGPSWHISLISGDFY